VLCEFKDIKTSLDAEQPRKGNTRSPVRQCLDYLSYARRGTIGSEPILPTWGLATDMNEFRLYWYDRGHQQFLRFVIEPRDLFQGSGLLDGADGARFDRFLFAKLLHRDTLLTTGGSSLLLQLIRQRRFRDREIEDVFYSDYRAFRDHLYNELLTHNGPGTTRFPGTRGRLVRLAQKILDRLLFVFFCEDMGQALAFPPKLLQEFLVSRANDPFFDPSGMTLWQETLVLFRSMNDGTAFGGRAIHQFNGGLFAPDATLEALHLPNAVFCQHLQGQDEQSIGAHPLTVLYFSATYNYAADLGQGGTRGERKSLGLYTLGRIFEQSITELEMLEAQADSRPSLNKLSKRKTDGVYYTPEWVVERVVDGTIRPCLDRIRTECGWPTDGQPPDVTAIDAYLNRLRTFTVLDPACGSGAFLITALRYLAAEWQSVQATRRQVAGALPAGVEDEAALVRDLLRSNIYGIDINTASVEIAQLALWLHTARGDQPLSSLENTIRCGNSLVTHDFYRGVQLTLDAAAQERVNAFDWQTAFPDVAERGGFDAVIGNPPYVKLQNLVAAQPDIADFLVNGRPAVGIIPYASTRTGNFDLYLPFIERGLSMLNAVGRLGFIAPSLWTVNEYGAGLRELVAKGKNLDRWLDFKSFQVFEESTTYTALQFFSRAPNVAIYVNQASSDVIPPDPWADAGAPLSWGAQEFGDRWLLLNGVERALVDRLASTCRRLDDPVHAKAIFVGLQTSADSIYHLKRLGPGRYLCKPPGEPRPTPQEVEIEDAIMHPLISGAEAKRYTAPATDTWLLFPYSRVGNQVTLIPASHMKSVYPKAWMHLKRYEQVLRGRESSRDSRGNPIHPFDTDTWYRFGRHQNLDKQHLRKLIVPRLVARLGCSVDGAGANYLDNVDVGGVLAGDGEDLWFLAGILNAPIANFVFQRISKPFRGGYLSANRQFIAPLPIPPATPEQRAAVAAVASELQRLHTARRDTLTSLARRLQGAATIRRPETWLLHGLPDRATLLTEAPPGLDERARRDWTTKEYSIRVKSYYGAIRPRLRPGAALEATLNDNELAFLVDGATVVDRVFVSESEGPFVMAQWKVIASTLTFTENTTGKSLCDALRTLVAPNNPALVTQVVAHATKLSAYEAAIHKKENEINALIFDLYQLDEAERRLVAASL
jgi:Eco57I restriction-modification methylase